MKQFLVLSLLAQSLIISCAYAEMNADEELQLADEAVSAPTLNIEGKYQKAKKPVEAPVVEARQVSPSERLKMARQRLEERNRIMIEKKMEQIRYQQEIALARELQKSMNQTLKSIDSIK